MTDQRYEKAIKKESGIKDLSFLIQQYQESLERLTPLINAKAAYLQRNPDNTRLLDELESLGQFFEEVQDVFGSLIERYNDLAADLLRLEKMYTASQEAIKIATTDVRYKEATTLFNLVHNKPVRDSSGLSGVRAKARFFDLKNSSK